MFDAQQKMHIIISAKDFKTIVNHAGTLETAMSAYYTAPGRPFQFSYGDHSVECQFTLMTAANYDNTPAASEVSTRIHSRTSSRAQSVVPSRSEESRSFMSDMPPPAVPKSRRNAGKLGQNETSHQPIVSQRVVDESESLFVRDDRDDRRWDPTDYEDQEQTFGWNASMDNDSAPFPTFRDSGETSKSRSFESAEEGLPPTQRISQIKGLW